MLFLGTKKYPSEEEYAAYLGKHGGSWNAYTDNEHVSRRHLLRWQGLEIICLISMYHADQLLLYSQY